MLNICLASAQWNVWFTWGALLPPTDRASFQTQPIQHVSFMELLFFNLCNYFPHPTQKRNRMDRWISSGSWKKAFIAEWVPLSKSLCYGNDGEEFVIYSSFPNGGLILLGLPFRHELFGKQTSPWLGMPLKHADLNGLLQKKRCPKRLLLRDT